MNGISQNKSQTPSPDESSSYDSPGLMKLARQRQRGRVCLLLMLLGLGMLLMACATTSTPPDSMPRNPSMPPPSQLQPSATYSSSAAADIASWRKRLTDMLATP